MNEKSLKSNNINILNKYDDMATNIKINSNNITGVIDFDKLKCLFKLYCYYNHITRLLNLSNGLVHLNCTSNPKIDLINLPDSIEYLKCDKCELVKLDMLRTFKI